MEAASDLAERVLARHGATRRRTEIKFRELMTLLAGYPLALEVVLANLKACPPAEVLAALEEGAAGLDAGGAEKTKRPKTSCVASSIRTATCRPRRRACSPASPPLPASSSNPSWRSTRSGWARLPFGRWPAVLKEMTDWGLLTPDPDVPAFLRIQPVLPKLVELFPPTSRFP